MSISPQSHRVGVDTFSFTNNYNASLPREGCARVVACCMVRRSRHKRLLCYCGVSDGPTNFSNNCNASIIREGYACAVAYRMVHYSRCKRLFCSCGVSDGPSDSPNNCNGSLLREGCACVVACCTVRRF